MHYAHSVEIKTLNAGSGEVEGYASVFGNVDHGLDRIEKGAFRKSIVGRKSIPMLAEHRDTVGVWNTLREDARGLKVAGRISDTALGRDVRTLAKDGAITGLSIGYRVKDADYDGDVRVIRDVDLLEVSLVTFPMNELAAISAAKSDLARGQIPDRSELERLLRAAGFTRRQVKRLLQHGFAGLSASHTAANLLEAMAERLEG